jgi:hypothetical protein
MTPRLFLLAGLVGAIVGASLGVILGAMPAQAVEYPWCANFHEGAGSNCGFTSYEQCMQTVRGSGGFCAANDFYTGPASPPQTRRPARHRPAAKKE